MLELDRKALTTQISITKKQIVNYSFTKLQRTMPKGTSLQPLEVTKRKKVQRLLMVTKCTIVKNLHQKNMVVVETTPAYNLRRTSLTMKCIQVPKEEAGRRTCITRERNIINFTTLQERLKATHRIVVTPSSAEVQEPEAERKNLSAAQIRGSICIPQLTLMTSMPIQKEEMGMIAPPTSWPTHIIIGTQ